MTAPLHIHPARPFCIIGADGDDFALVRSICGTDGDEDKAEMHERTRRIVAAVNATAGISTEALEAGCIAELVEAAQRSETALHNLVVLLTDRDPTETEAMIVKLVGAVSRELEAVLAPLKGEGK